MKQNATESKQEVRTDVDLGHDWVMKSYVKRVWGGRGLGCRKPLGLGVALASFRSA